MDTDTLKAPVRSEVLRWLKAEAFYLVVLIAVVVVGALRTAGSFTDPEAGARAAAPIDQRVLRQPKYELIMRQTRRNPRIALFYNGVRMLNFALFTGGVAALLGLAFVRLYRPHLPTAPRVWTPEWGLWDVLKAAGLFAGGSMVFHAIFETDELRAFWAPGDWMAEIFARVLLIGIVVHVTIAERNARLSDLGFRQGALRSLIVGLLGFLVMQPILGLIEAAELRWVHPLPLQEPLQAILLTNSRATLALAVVTAVVIAPVSEELLFRSFLQPALQRWVGQKLGIFVAAAFFAAAHMDLYVLPVMAALGLALGYVYDRTRNLAAPVALHMAYNGMSMLMILAIRALHTAR